MITATRKRTRRYLSVPAGSYPPPVPPDGGPLAPAAPAERTEAEPELDFAAPADPAPPTDKAAAVAAAPEPGPVPEPILAGEVPSRPAEAGTAPGEEVPARGSDPIPLLQPPEAKRSAARPLAGMLVGSLFGSIAGAVVGTLLLAFARTGRFDAAWREPIDLWTSLDDPVLAASASLVLAGFAVLGLALGWRGRGESSSPRS